MRWHVTNYARDGGIDGVINEDKLGLDVVCVQAKRWQGNVSRPTIQAFVGNMGREHIANAGVVAPSEGRSRESDSRTCRDSLLTGETSFSRDDKTGVS